MLRNSLLSVVLLMFLSACAIPHKQLDDNPAFSSHQYKSSDFDIIWKAEKLDNALLIEGAITDVRIDTKYDFLELDVMLLDSKGKVIAKESYHRPPYGMDHSESFKMKIPLEKDMQPESIKFNYRYGINEDRYSVNFVSKP